jgi:hypothetical protein
VVRCYRVVMWRLIRCRNDIIGLTDLIDGMMGEVPD